MGEKDRHPVWGHGQLQPNRTVHDTNDTVSTTGKAVE